MDILIVLRRNFKVLKEFVAPVVEALVAVASLLVISTRQILQPVQKEVSIFLQDQELAENDVGLV